MSESAPSPRSLAARHPSLRRIRIAVFASGTGTTLQAIMDACVQGTISGDVVLVVSNVPGAGALARAQGAGIPAEVVNHRTSSQTEFEHRLLDLTTRYDVDLVCLAGFMRILSPSCVRPLAGRVMNVHPSLLPAFGGKGMYGERVHTAVLAHGAKITGCTVHLVDESPDGGPIILQRAVPVADDDTAPSLAVRVQAQERQAYCEAISLFAQGRLILHGRRVQILPAPHPDGLPAHVLA